MDKHKTRKRKAQDSFKPRRKNGSHLEFEREVIEFYSKLGLANLPVENNEITMFPYKPFQIRLSSGSETNQ